MSAEVTAESHLEIAHVLFVDIVAYSKLLSSEQRELFALLNDIIRNTQQFGAADVAGKLVRIPTGDGMALVFFTSVDAPVRCALEMSGRLREHPNLRVRMGINSGPVDHAVDVNDQRNITGAGINMAQRVMDCGDAGHILLSRRVADDLAQYAEWKPYLHDLGQIEVKHGVHVALANFHSDDFGNAKLPAKIVRAKELKRRRVLLWVSAILAFLICITIGSWVWQRRAALTAAYKISAAGISEKSVAVLPLENLSEEKENAYFADGIQDELLSNLSRIKDLKVISRTSVMQYKVGVTRNLKEIAQQLGVSKVVEGSVRRSGNHIRVSVQLIDALTDRHIWASNYDRTLADSLALQGELATEIAAEVGATLNPQEKVRVETQPTNNADAYDAYLRGRAITIIAMSERANVERAVRSYEEAVKLDPNFALAWVYLSRAQSLYYRSADPSPARLAAAKDALDRALALDANLPEAHLARGYYRFQVERDFTGALSEFQKAEQGLPNNADIFTAISMIQRRRGRSDEALEAARRAVSLDPRNRDACFFLATTYSSQRRFHEAIATADRVLAFEPTDRHALNGKVYGYLAIGDLKAAEPLLADPVIEPSARGLYAFFHRDYAAAAEIFSKTTADDVNREWPEVFALGVCQQRTSNVAAARETFQGAIEGIQRELAQAGPDPLGKAELHGLLGVAYALLGEATPAITEGEKAIALKSTSEDSYDGPTVEENVAQIYAALGEADHAVPILKRLLQIPYREPITRGRLRIDPFWDPIRNDPRFNELIAEASKPLN